MELSREAPHGFVMFEIDGVDRWFPLSKYSSGVTVANVGAYPAKTIIGDFRETDHELNSSLVQNDWSGGGQISDSQETTDLSRYHGIATLDTRFPRRLSLLPITRVVTASVTGMPMLLGDLVSNDTAVCYAAYGTTLTRITGSAKAATATEVGSLPVTPTREAVQFRVNNVEMLFIPGGGGAAGGYCTFNGATISTRYTTVKPLSFTVHDRKIWAIDGDGTIWKNVSGDSTAWTEVIRTDPGYRPRGVVPFFDRSDAPAIHAVTDAMVFAVDPSVPAIYQTECNYAPSRKAGLAWERWRTDLYVSIGMGIQRYTLGTVNATGPDRDDGPGKEWAGHITCLRKSFNDLWALIQGSPTPGSARETISVDQGEEVYLSMNAPYSTLLRMNGSMGWHTGWASPKAGGIPTNVVISTADQQYRLYWGWDGAVWFMDLPVDFDNPLQNPTSEFAETGEMTSSWFNMNRETSKMILAGIEARAMSASESETIRIEYQIDDDDLTGTWRPLMTITAPGHFRQRVGRNGDLADGSARYDGLGFGRMRYRVTMTRGDDTSKSPVLSSVSMVYQPLMGALKSFSFRVDCSSPEMDSGWGYGNRERREALERLMFMQDDVKFVKLKYNDREYLGRISGLSGQDESGMDLRGDRTVTFVEGWQL